MSELRELRNDIAASIFMHPCTLKVLAYRDFLSNISEYGIQYSIKDLERVDAIYYREEIMHVKKKWAKENLHGYEIDIYDL